MPTSPQTCHKQYPICLWLHPVSCQVSECHQEAKSFLSRLCPFELWYHTQAACHQEFSGTPVSRKEEEKKKKSQKLDDTEFSGGYPDMVWMSIFLELKWITANPEEIYKVLLVLHTPLDDYFKKPQFSLATPTTTLFELLRKWAGVIVRHYLDTKWKRGFLILTV